MMAQTCNRALVRLRQENYHQVQASLGYIMSASLGYKVKPCHSNHKLPQRGIILAARKWKQRETGSVQREQLLGRPRWGDG